MKNYKVLDKNKNVLGYVVNSKNEDEARKMAIKQKDYHIMIECESLNVPSMFQNCFMN